MSCFSFYYAHHLSTIEGGMICTNNKILRNNKNAKITWNVKRGNKIMERKLIKKYSNLSPKFIFMYPGYNFRNNEISAVIGLNQLKRIDKNNKLRNNNFYYFKKF